jgi:uncharacterized protein with FMN-binding domain
VRRAPLLVAAGAAGFAAVVWSHPGKPAVSKPTATRSATPPQPSAPAGGPTASLTGTATGRPENYGYGTLAVSVTAANGRIVQVTVPQLHTIDSYSQYIAQQVVPILRRQVLNLQSANIQGVSGASYTSAAFAYSLQSALTKLGMR